MRKYKLDDSHIFKPVKRQLTLEEELQAEKDVELFCDMMEKNGMASLLNPSEEISRAQFYGDVRSGKTIVIEHHDSTGQTDFFDYLKRIMDGDL